jgi:hypothetical protein
LFSNILPGGVMLAKNAVIRLERRLKYEIITTTNLYDKKVNNVRQNTTTNLYDKKVASITPPGKIFENKIV